MSRRDAESLAMEKWLLQLGYPTQLQPEEVQKLLTPNMRSVWRHLKKCVKPVCSIETVRKNLLLAKLKKENIKPDQIGNFKIQSCDELSLVERVSDIQREIDSMNIERKTVDDEIKSLLRTITEQKYNVISKKNTIKEIEDKTTLLNLKLGQFQKDIDQLNEDNSKARMLGMFKVSSSYKEDSSNVSNIATFLMNRKVSPNQLICKEDKELLTLSKGCSANTCYQAFLLASDSVYKSLKHFTANVEIPDENIKDAFASNGDLSFSNHLKHLNSLIVHNQFDILDCLEKIKESSALLNEDKIELLNLIKGSCKNKNNDFNEDKVAEEFAEKLMNNCLSSTERVVIKELIGELDTHCLEYDNLKQHVENSKKKENELHEEVRRKVCFINELYSKIYKFNAKIDQVKNEIINKSNESVSSFRSEIVIQKDLEIVIQDSEHTIIDEIKMFHDSHLSALTRRWENVHELLPREIIEELSTDPKLRIFLLQCEPKNILKSILERIWWSLNLKYELTLCKQVANGLNIIYFSDFANAINLRGVLE